MKFIKPKVQVPASEALEQVVEQTTQEVLTLGDLMHAMHERGFAMLMAILVLPNCVPIPVPPGTSTVFSIPLLYLSVQMLMGYDAPKLPAFLNKKNLKRSLLAALVRKISPRLKWIEKLLHPRFPVFNTRMGEKILGFFWLLFAISIAIPLPMTNFLPGVGILVTSLGLMNRDGVTVIIGILIGLFGIGVTTGVLLVGEAAVRQVLSFMADWL